MSIRNPLITEVSSDPNCSATSALLDAAAITDKFSVVYNTLVSELNNTSAACSGALNNALISATSLLNNLVVKKLNYTNDTAYITSTSLTSPGVYLFSAQVDYDGVYTFKVNTNIIMTYTPAAAEYQDNNDAYLLLPIKENCTISGIKSGDTTEVWLGFKSIN